MNNKYFEINEATNRIKYLKKFKLEWQKRFAIDKSEHTENVVFSIDQEIRDCELFISIYSNMHSSENNAKKLTPKNS